MGIAAVATGRSLPQLNRQYWEIQGPRGILTARPVDPRRDDMDANRPPDDCDLVTAVLADDGERYRDLVERHQGSTAALLWRFTRDRTTLEELVQETFVEAYLSLRSFRAGGSFPAWLRTIAIRTGYRHWTTLAGRRAGRETPIEGLEETLTNPAPADPGRAAELLHALLARLAPADRLVLTLHHLEGRSVEEIAQDAGWTKVGVRVRLHRARRRLAKVAADA